MTRHATHWPDGTPRSQHNAFTQPERHRAMGIDSIWAEDYGNCTSLYNQWRACQRTGHGRGAHMTWPQFRDNTVQKLKNIKDAYLDAKASGFRATNGTILGLSAKADAMIANQAKLMPITAAPWNTDRRTAKKPPHGGAYSQAKPAKPAKGRKVAA